jgi:hypothetical protein
LLGIIRLKAALRTLLDCTAGRREKSFANSLLFWCFFFAGRFRDGVEQQRAGKEEGASRP